MLKRINVFILVGLFLLTACSREDKAVVELLDRADSLLRVNPDSALKLLSPPLFSPPLGEVGRGFRMRYQLLLADALNKTDRAMPSDTVMQEVVDYYDRHGNANVRMRAHYLLGRVYHDMGEAPQALECYQQAAEQADTTSTDCDLYNLYAVYGQMADLYYYQYLPDDEMQALKACERIAWKDHDTLSAIKAIELRLRPYYQKNDTDSVLYYVNTSYQLYKKYGYNKEAANILNMKIAVYLDRRQYNMAGSLLDIYRRESGLFDSEGNIIRGREIRYYDEGRYQLGIGHADSAIYWFRRVLDYGYKEAGYKGLLDVYKQKRIPDSIAKYAELFAKANDDSYLENSMELVSKQTELYNYERNRNIAEQKKQELERTQRRVFFLVAGLLLVIWLFWRHGRKERAARNAEIQQLTEKYEHSIAEEQRTLEELHSLKELSSLSNETNERLHTELQSKIESLQAKLSLEEAESDGLRKKLQVYKKSEMESSFLNSDIVRYFMQLRGNTKETGYKLPTKKDWDKLLTRTKVCRPELFELLNSRKGLSEKEQHLLLLLLLGFRGKDIMALWNLSYQNITNMRSRINEKLFDSDSSKSLDENLSAFFIKK